MMQPGQPPMPPGMMPPGMQQGQGMPVRGHAETPASAGSGRGPARQEV